jgi:hypothetical protein
MPTASLARDRVFVDSFALIALMNHPDASDPATLKLKDVTVTPHGREA